MYRSKKTSNIRVTALCKEKPPMTGGFPSQRSSNAENVSIWLRHHDDIMNWKHCPRYSPFVWINIRETSNKSLLLKGIHPIWMTSHQRYVISNHRSFDCLFHSFCRPTSKKQGGAVLILLDLSAAFDTIGHSILWLPGLGMWDAASHWFRWYLIQWRRSVLINATRSSHRNLSFGVPQGSVFGPISFTLYTTPLGTWSGFLILCRRHATAHGLQTGQYGIITPCTCPF